MRGSRYCENRADKWKDRAKQFKALWLEAMNNETLMREEVKSRQRECDRLNQQLDEIFRQLEDVERIMAELLDNCYGES